MNEWTVNLLGEFGSGFELSIVRNNNKHGFISYGWIDENKLLVSSSYHQFTVTNKLVWDGLLKLAAEVCQKMNEA